MPAYFVGKNPAINTLLKTASPPGINFAVASKVNPGRSPPAMTMEITITSQVVTFRPLVARNLGTTCCVRDDKSDKVVVMGKPENTRIATMLRLVFIYFKGIDWF